MWEAIQSNRRRSRILLAAMGVILVALGAIAGLAFDPEQGLWFGTLAALGLYFVLLGAAFLQGEEVVLLAAGARKIEKQDAPRLWNVIEEMTIASGLAAMPQVYLIDEDAPNAFAVGVTPERARIAVTTGLVKRMSRDELQGVVAHELAHVRNLDTRFMTLVSVMAGAIVLISDGLFRVFRYGGVPRRSSRGKGGGLPFVLLALVAAILAPIVAQLLYLACSRRREFLADASAARFTRYPDGLASALEKIAAQAPSMKVPNRAVAPLFIVNPLRGLNAGHLFSTHPPIEERIRILRDMGGMAGYADYEAAFRKVRGAGGACLGPRTLAADERVAARAATPEANEKAEAIERAREVGEVVGRLAGLLLVPCACGVGIKIPPDLDRASVTCPRCGRENTIPRLAATA